jgi:predicted nuclease of restriction endonuclease-like (RecB) superfamily
VCEFFSNQSGEEKAKYGDKVISELSKQMTYDFGKGYDATNLRKMRQFYLMFPICASVKRELNWSHYRLLIRIENSKIREFYMEEAIKGNWSVRQLERQISSCTYSRVLKHKQEVEIIEGIDEESQSVKYDPNTVIKDPYMLEFLGLASNSKYLEKDLEKALIDHLQKFLLELGRGFCFVERQKRISFDDEHYFIDLVFYNSILKCYVVIDLKTGKLGYEHLAQIDMYRNYYDKEIKAIDDNPTIGLVLVTEQSKSVAKYSSIYKDENIFISKYMTCMPSEKELEKVVDEERKLIEEYKALEEIKS